MNTAYSYIRFSTPAQALGFSMRRQLENAEACAKEKGLFMDNCLTFHDLGVSAYRGKNFEDGALGAFVKAVESGRVKPGSVLLVENLDRLSRAEVPIALERFLSILRLGIRILTLTDRQEYSYETVKDNPTQLIISIVYMIRANNESKEKAKRVADSWLRKRAAAIKSHKALTRQCPAWLQVNGDVKSDIRTYTEIEDRVKIVRLIFKLTVDGWGQGRIAAHLTKEGIKPWGPGRRRPGTKPGPNKPPRGSRWHDSYIMQITQNRAVLGELQLYKGDGKRNRSPVGEPIPNFYPAIISPGLFAQVQALRQSRRIHNFVGRQSDNISNLFQGLVYDLHSKERCIYASHGKGTTWQYIKPPVMVQGQHGWNYSRFEATFLEHCRLINWAEIFGGSTREAVSVAAREVDAAKAELTRIEADLARYTEAVATAPDLQSLVGKLRKLEESRALAKSALRMATDSHAAASARYEALDADANRLQTLASAKLDTPEARLRLREEIRRVVNRIDASFTKRGGFYMVVNYTNGASRYIRPNRIGPGVQIWDAREDGFMGTPEQWKLGAGALENDESEQEEAAF